MIFPGQSLTAEPKNAPYENPPKYTTPEDGLEYHLERLSTEDKLEDLLDALELGLDVVTITEGVLRGAVLQGVHSVDVSLIIAPVIHEFINGAAKRAGIEYDEGFPDETKDRRKVEYALNGVRAKKVIASFEEDGDIEEGLLDEKEVDKVDEEPIEEGKGLMSRMARLEGDM